MAYTYRPDERQELRDEITRKLIQVGGALGEWLDHFESDHPMHHRLRQIKAEIMRHEDTLDRVCRGCAKIPDDRGECECSYAD